MKYNVEFSSNYFVCNLCCSPDFKPFSKDHVLYDFGYVKSNDEEVFWDCTPYFFNLDKEETDDIKKELKKAGIWHKGMLKDLKNLMEEVKKWKRKI